LFSGLDFFDLTILSIVFICSAVISFYDFKYRSFPCYLLFVLALDGIVWCFKQSFIPIAILPIGLALAIVCVINHCFIKIIGNGDIFLFLIAGLFIHIHRLSTFVILCGLIGVCIYATMRTRVIPFSFAILLAASLTFCLDLVAKIG
jgi:hypothetical protein